MSTVEDTLRLEPVRDFEEVREEWQTLALRAGNLFGTWEWVSLWWRHFGAGREHVTTMLRDHKGRAVGVLPLYIADRRPVRTLRFIGNGHSDRLHPVCAPNDRVAVVGALRDALHAGRWDWEAFFAEDMPADEGWAGQLGGRPWGTVADPVFRIRARDWDDYLSTRTRHFRRRLSYRERRLRRTPGMAFRLADDPARLDEDLAALRELHALRFAGDSQVLAGPQAAFHADFARVALRRGWLRLWFLELEGRPVAVWWGYRYCGIEWFYNSGRDPRAGDEADGHLLMVHSLREAVADGIGEYRYLRGDNPYKARFANVDAGLQAVALTRGPQAAAALIAARAVRGRERAARAPGPLGRGARLLTDWSFVAGGTRP